MGNSSLIPTRGERGRGLARLGERGGECIIFLWDCGMGGILLGEREREIDFMKGLEWLGKMMGLEMVLEVFFYLSSHGAG